MNDTTSSHHASPLDPLSRISEILFGLIMVLSFTSSLRAADVIHENVHEMLLGALGCNLAWGIIDALMYLMNIAAERGREDFTARKLRTASTPSETYNLLREALPDSFSRALSDADLDQVRTSILKEIGPRRRWLLSISDLRAALIVFALVFITTFPVAIPFMFMQDLWRALRVSNLIALLLLFNLGLSLGRYAGRSAWRWGLGMTLLGFVLVSIAISFGG
jgi:VIT1/CCC1 family predicted Fe2+/Mn2+ transporter